MANKKTQGERAKEYLIANKQLIGLIVTLIVGLLLGKSFPYIPSDYGWAIFFSIIVAIGLFLACLYLLEFFQGYNRINKISRLNEKLPQDVKMLKWRKTITFSEESLRTGYAKVHLYRELINQMKNQDYYEFKISISSSQHIPLFRDIKFRKNGKDFRDLTELSTKCKVYKIYSVEERDEKLVTSTLRFFFPIDLKYDERCNFEVEYKTKAFLPAIEKKCDSTTLGVSRYIEDAIVEIKLEEDLKRTHKLCQCIERNDHEPYTFEIIDESDQRMWYWEVDSSKNFQCPNFNEDFIQWNLPDPKVGYKYRLYFTIREKEENT